MNTAVKVEESVAISQTEEMTQILNALTALRRGEESARLRRSVREGKNAVKTGAM
jgi:hypothetical protein